jgi:hypothetical protein
MTQDLHAASTVCRLPPTEVCVIELGLNVPSSMSEFPATNCQGIGEVVSRFAADDHPGRDLGLARTVVDEVTGSVTLAACP